MRWARQGLIFDPLEHRLAEGCAEFAQAPQALVFDAFVRIYFSTRSVDPNGKFRSRMAFADFTRDFGKVLRVSSEPVVPLGNLGCFDEHGIFPMNVVRRGDEVLGYTCGWSRRAAVSVETAIGLVVSRDGGETFQREGEGPVLAASTLEPCLVGDAFVRIVDGVFHMWHIFGTGWAVFAPGAAPDRVYKIGHATSPDGRVWAREEGLQVIEDVLGPSECQALPSVVAVGGRHLMVFCFREAYGFRSTPGRGYRLGHACSDDLAHWTRDDGDPYLEIPPGQWDSDMQCYPHVFELDGRVHLLYNGNEFGRRGFGLARLEP
jgi:hypothetical protein